MASIFATMYVKMIKIGKRTIDDVRPDELKQEVIDLLIEEGKYDLAEVKGPEADDEVPDELGPTDSEDEAGSDKDGKDRE